MNYSGQPYIFLRAIRVVAATPGLLTMISGLLATSCLVRSLQS